MRPDGQWLEDVDFRCAGGGRGDRYAACPSECRGQDLSVGPFRSHGTQCQIFALVKLFFKEDGAEVRGTRASAPQYVRPTLPIMANRALSPA